MTVRLRSKVVEIDAVLWTGENREEVEDFVGHTAHVRFDNTNGEHLKVWNYLEEQWINTPRNHYLLKGLMNEFYPCDPEVLFMKYEIV